MGCFPSSSKLTYTKSIQVPPLSASTSRSENETRSTRPVDHHMNNTNTTTNHSTDGSILEEITPDSSTEIDVRSFQQIVDGVNFSNVINADVKFQTTEQDSPTGNNAFREKSQQKEPHNSAWNKKHYTHGDLSDVLTEIDSQTHGCFNSSVGKEIDSYLAEINRISIQADEHIRQRITQISSIEQITIKQLIEQRQTLINIIIQQGGVDIQNYERHYRRLIEEYIAQLEIEMSRRLDHLYTQLDAYKIDVLNNSKIGIKDLTIKVEDAKRKAIEHVQRRAAVEIDRILEEVKKCSVEKTPLGYEQLNTVNLQIYSTVGIKEDEDGCDNISERGKFIKEIKKAKSAHSNNPPKRTVYLSDDYKTALQRPVNSP